MSVENQQLDSTQINNPSIGLMESSEASLTSNENLLMSLEQPWDETLTNMEQSFDDALVQAKIVEAQNNSDSPSPSSSPAPPQIVGGQAGGEENWLDNVQTILDYGGMLPGIGEPLDALNALIYTARGDYTNAALSAAAIVPLAGIAAAVIKLGGKSVTKVTQKVVTTEITKESVINGLRGTTEQANRIVNALENKKIGLNILGDDLFNKYLTRLGGDPKYTLAFELNKQMYIPKSAPEFLSLVVHEGTHALDELKGFKGNIHSWEKRAFFYEEQFQKATGGRVSFESPNQMIDFIKKNYENGFYD